MPTDPIKVVAQRDTFLRIARARPLTAIAELIWNSLDADATTVTVYFDENELGLRGVIVEDDGDGATPEQAREFFRRLGGSWKKPGARTKRHGRVLHGSQGQGRYKALSVGRSIKWTYYYEQNGDIYEFALSILGDDPSEVRASDPKKSDRDRAGCIVEIQDPIRQFKNLDGEEAVLEITELFAIYLADYPDVRVSYAGQALELKRPGVAVGQDEINQISKYAASIEKDGRFATRDGVVWRYWVISDTLDDMGKWQVEQDQNGRGMIRDTPKSKIYVRTWDQLIEENKAKYQFIQERLNFSANDERAMSYLRGEYAALLDGVTVASDDMERQAG